jgi:hypothetical protein
MFAAELLEGGGDRRYWLLSLMRQAGTDEFEPGWSLRLFAPPQPGSRLDDWRLGRRGRKGVGVVGLDQGLWWRRDFCGADEVVGGTETGPLSLRGKWL